ncbi:hypothetical protein BFN03_05140 [Rhodococcus sp. WMMA185]|nr:hypothetical protein BFN03_05140 [Rhodococcus sp. WMMA185]
MNNQHHPLAGLFDGREIVITFGDMDVSPQQLAAIAYERGYVFAWGKRYRHHSSDRTYYHFRRLFPAKLEHDRTETHAP